MLRTCEECEHVKTCCELACSKCKNMLIGISKEPCRSCWNSCWENKGCNFELKEGE